MSWHFSTVDLARLCDVNKSVNVHLGVDAEILEVGLCDHRADGVRHTADTQLEARTVRDLLNDQLCDRLIDCGRCSAAAHLRHGLIILDDHIDLGNMDRFLIQAEAARHILVDLDDNNIEASRLP